MGDAATPDCHKTGTVLLGSGSCNPWLLDFIFSRLCQRIQNKLLLPTDLQQKNIYPSTRFLLAEWLDYLHDAAKSRFSGSASMPRFLIACDKFKGSLTAPQACAAVARGILRSLPYATMDECPIADGGEGFADALMTALGGTRVSFTAEDALGRPIDANYGIINGPDGSTAVMEMAETAGLWRIAEPDRDILHSHTRGVGMMLRHAADAHQVKRIILGIGGSATNDGGAGCLHGLGVRFLDTNGDELPPTPDGLLRLATIDTTGLIPLPPLTIACDVTNPLLGPRGAARVFAPQKGACDALLPILEAALDALVRTRGGEDDAEAPCSGAAGGLGFGLLHFLHADLQPGFDIISRTVDFPARVAAADIVVTGEGSLDSQSLAGKGPAGVALQALLAAKPVIALVGRADTAVKMSGLFHHIGAVLERGPTIAQCLERGAHYLEEEATLVPWHEWLGEQHTELYAFAKDR